MMIGLKNNLINTINFSNAGNLKIMLSGRVLIRPRTLHARMLYCLNREPIILRTNYGSETVIPLYITFRREKIYSKSAVVEYQDSF